MLRSNVTVLALVVSVCIGCTKAGTADTPTGPSSESDIRQLLTHAAKGDYAFLAGWSANAAAEVNGIQANNPQSLWPKLIQAVNDREVQQLTSGDDCCTPLQELVRRTAFPHHVVGFESRPGPQGQSNYVTIEYDDAKTAPVSESVFSFSQEANGSFEKRIVLNISTDEHGRVLRVEPLAQGFVDFPDSPFMITAVNRFYHGQWGLAVKVVGAQGLVDFNVDCGPLGSVERKRVSASVNNSSVRVSHLVPDIVGSASSGACVVTATDDGGHVDKGRLRFGSGVPEYACWPRPAFLTPHLPSPYKRIYGDAIQACNIVISPLEPVEAH